MTLTTDLKEDRRRRLINQRQFRRHFVRCHCKRGCLVCAYTGLVSKGHAKHALGERPDEISAAAGSNPP